MLTNRVIFFSNFTSQVEYQKEVKSAMIEVLKHQIKLLGLSTEDLEDPFTVKKYKIGRDDKEKEGEYLTQTARAMGIKLVQVTWEPDKATISTPCVVPDYTLTLEYIKQMPQKPKDEQSQS